MANTLEDVNYAVQIHKEKFGVEPAFADPIFPLESGITRYLLAIDKALRNNKPVFEKLPPRGEHTKY
tara:strand:+ start:1575 stop:1775 length:201 start_codon:yes stop_codon:yes gene_type:complete